MFFSRIFSYQRGSGTRYKINENKKYYTFYVICIMRATVSEDEFEWNSRRSHELIPTKPSNFREKIRIRKYVNIIRIFRKLRNWNVQKQRKKWQRNPIAISRRNEIKKFSFPFYSHLNSFQWKRVWFFQYFSFSIFGRLFLHFFFRWFCLLY